YPGGESSPASGGAPPCASSRLTSSIVEVLQYPCAHATPKRTRTLEPERWAPGMDQLSRFLDPTMTRHTISGGVKTLAARGRAEYGAEYASNGLGGMQNHLPMCLYALGAMGASESRLIGFYDWYVPRLEKRSPAVRRIDQDGWETLLGHHAGNDEYFSFFSEQAEVEGLDRVLDRYLPRLFRGVGGGAFHPLIRLAYALEMDSLDEACEALAAWCMAYRELGDAEFAERRDLRTSVAAFSSDPYFREARPREPGILRRMEKVAADPRFAATVHRSGPPGRDVIAGIARLSLDTFLSAPSFVTLHLVTSSHALRIVDRHVPLQNEWLEGYWIAWLAAYVTLGAPDLSGEHS